MKNQYLPQSVNLKNVVILYGLRGFGLGWGLS